MLCQNHKCSANVKMLKKVAYFQRLINWWLIFKTGLLLNSAYFRNFNVSLCLKLNEFSTSVVLRMSIIHIDF